eukprot:TRINITY_DN3517_c0_g1_i1.p1 TRINITY_DN3517_c0_g1~~TRINITY_DN3517_c0_g1_i1.p1  ORF type:complete len:641 (+),score=89.71 TRINITY_DN3517_c0_g1_i1:111-2033(+)
MDERELRKQQRRNELAAKQERLRKLKEQNRDTSRQPAATESAGAASLDLRSIDNVADLLRTLEDTAVATVRDEPASPARTNPTAALHTPVKSSALTDVSEPGAGAISSPARPSLQDVIATKRAGLSIQLNLIVHDVAPKEVEVYARATQTTISAFSGDVAEVEEVEEIKPVPISQRDNFTGEKKESKEKEREPEETKNEPVPVRELNASEKKEVMQRPEFLQFFGRAARILERAISVGSKFDVVTNYAQDDNAGSKADNSREVALQATLFDERWSKHRSITSVSWSPKHSELVAVSYSGNETGSHDPDGVVAVWSTQNLLNRPEYVFQCQSTVMSVVMPEYHPTLVIGGTYSGQIVIWDMRSSSLTPVLRTPLSSIGHTHPVYCLDVVGTAHAHNIVSVSTDGRMCSWSLESLTSPIDIVELRSRAPHASAAAGSSQVAPLCMSFPAGEVNQLLLGTEDGGVYEAYRHGAKAGVHDAFRSHKGPVTSVDCHPAHGPIDFSHLFLTSSMDWSCKLWSRKNTAAPVHSFEDNSDYQYYVRWSPVHPAVFAAVGGTATLDLWNLNEDTEAPVVRTSIPSLRSLNTLCWAPSGRKVAVGDCAGSLYVYDLPEATVTPRSEEWEQLDNTLHFLSQANATPEVDQV